MTFVYRYDTDKQRPIYTLSELADCALREAMIRRKVYPGRVDTGRMNALAADREIAMMLQIAEHMRDMAQFGRLL